jgi:hypothetical protein
MSQQQRTERATKQLIIAVSIPIWSEVFVQEVMAFIEGRIESTMDEASSYYKTAWSLEWKAE